jgi:hypothetical protein
MRTTITLADDVVAAIEHHRHERALGLSAAVNDLVRAGVTATTAAPGKRRFQQIDHDLGRGIDYRNVAEALDALDG